MKAPVPFTRRSNHLIVSGSCACDGGLNTSAAAEQQRQAVVETGAANVGAPALSQQREA
jgi:coenzyme F420-reducing hydrogenase gamma subunit